MQAQEDVVSAESKAKPSHQPHRGFSRGRLGLFLLLLAVVLLGGYGWMRYRGGATKGAAAAPDQEPAYEFLALQYGEIGEASDAMRPDLFAEHLDSLREAGFVFITLRDVMELLRRGAPVPPRAVLLTIDSNRASTLEAAHRVLKHRQGAHAVLFSESQTLAGSGDGGLMTWRRAQKMARTPQWEIGLRSAQDAENERLLLDASGNLTQMEEVEQRIALDRKEALKKYRAFLPEGLAVYAFGQGQFGQQRARGDLEQLPNPVGTEDSFDYFFTAGGLGVNTMFHDPKRLNRLSVDPSWRGAALLQAAQRAFDAGLRVEGEAGQLRRAGAILDWGEVLEAGPRFALRATEQTVGARCWLAGSELLRDFDATLSFTVEQGGLAVYLFAARRLDEFFCLEIHPNGDVLLQQRTSKEAAPRLLNRSHIELARVTPHKLEITVRGRFVDAWMNGLPLFSRSTALPETALSGWIGLSAFDERKGQARLLVEAVSINRIKPVLTSWNVGEDYTDYILSKLRQEGNRFQLISPPWAVFEAASGPSNTTWGLFETFAKLQASRIVPKLKVSNATELAAAQPSMIAQEVLARSSDGLYVDLSDYKLLEERPLEDWVTQTARTIASGTRLLYVRLPDALQRRDATVKMLARIPAVRLVVPPGGEKLLPPGEAVGWIQETVIPPPEGTFTSSALTLPDRLPETPGPLQAQQIDLLQAEGNRAFMDGDYDRAMEAFAQWHHVEPHRAYPLRRIGDVLLQMGYRGEALDFYRQSLDADPGQVDLAEHTARLLMAAQRYEEAKDLLNTFARLFPDDHNIILVQAEWLFGKYRNEEAMERIRRIQQRDPENLQAAFLLLRLATTADEVRPAQEHLRAIAAKPGQHVKILETILAYDLLTMPRARMLLPIIDHIAASNDDAQVQTLVAKLQPRRTEIAELFTGQNKLSNAWRLIGGNEEPLTGGLRIQTNPNQMDCSMELLHTERWRDSYVEAQVASLNGEAWLYLRQSRDTLVRLGIDKDNNRIYLQVWKDNSANLVSSEFRELSPFTWPLALRLEVRGNGANAFINGEPMLPEAMGIPPDVGPGRCNIAIHAADRGRAQVVFQSIQAGPLPCRLVALPKSPSQTAPETELALLRSVLPYVTAYCPTWFTIDREGRWSSTLNVGDPFFRTFAKFHRIAFWPMAEAEAEGVAPNVDDLVQLAQLHAFDGVVLRVREWPNEAWVASLESALEQANLDAVLIRDGANPQVRGLGKSRALFLDADAADPLVVLTPENYETEIAAHPRSPVLLQFTEPLVPGGGEKKLPLIEDLLQDTARAPLTPPAPPVAPPPPAPPVLPVEPEAPAVVPPPVPPAPAVEKPAVSEPAVAPRPTLPGEDPPFPPAEEPPPPDEAPAAIVPKPEDVAPVKATPSTGPTPSAAEPPAPAPEPEPPAKPAPKPKLPEKLVPEPEPPAKQVPTVQPPPLPAFLINPKQ